MGAILSKKGSLILKSTYGDSTRARIHAIKGGNVTSLFNKALTLIPPLLLRSPLMAQIIPTVDKSIKLT
ncbi:hypothetical protein D3C86_1985880 [compost metagenome]